MNEVFYWKDISIFQNQEVLKVGTDAILLGSWISHLSIYPDTILDVGSGTGILSLMMASIFPNAKIDAIDHQEAAVSLTNYNFISSGSKQRLKAMKKNILSREEDVSSYDLVICNPPFFFNQLQPGDANRRGSRHTNHPADIWMRALSRRCNENGMVSLILPHQLASGWIQAGNALGMYCQVRKNIYSFRNDQDPVRSLVLFGKTLKPLQMDHLIIYESPDQYTQVYRDFTGL